MFVMSNDDYTKTFDRPAAYPFVNKGMFEKSSVVSIESGFIKVMLGDIAIQRSLFDQQLDGATSFLPSYDLILSDGTVLHDLIPVIAIGSNSSPFVMIEKFRSLKAEGDFAILQGTIKDHSVVHGAFVGAKGTIPATLVPDAGSETHITVGFYTKDQANKLTTTEPNYDLVALKAEIELRGFNPAVPPGALGYVSPWGALTKDGQNPLILDSIPSTSQRETVSSIEAMNMIADIEKAATAKELAESQAEPTVVIVDPPERTTAEWFNDLSLGIENRLRVNNILKAHALPAVIAGTQIKPATIGVDAANLKLPGPSSIEYL